MTANETTTLVTGATGFIGNRLVERLRESGRPVNVLARTSGSGDRFHSLGCRVVVGDVTLPGSLDASLNGCGTVIHCAVGGGDLQQAREINVQGTLNLIEAAARNGARRIVHLSTVVAHGRDWPAVLTETFPLQFRGDHYAVSKAESERFGRERAQALGVEFAVVRPTIVYGPRSGRILIDLARVNLEHVKLVARGMGLANMIYVDDLVDGILLAERAAGAANEAFLMSGPAPCTWADYFTELARLCDKPSPPAIATARARVEAWWSKWHFRFTRHPRRIEDTDFALMGHRSAVSIDKARRVLGFVPRVTLAEGMRHTAAWLRELGYLPRASQRSAA